MRLIDAAEADSLYEVMGPAIEVSGVVGGQQHGWVSPVLAPEAPLLARWPMIIWEKCLAMICAPRGSTMKHQRPAKQAACPPRAA